MRGEDLRSFSEASICSSGCKKTESKITVTIRKKTKIRNGHRGLQGELKLLQSVPWKDTMAAFELSLQS